MTQEQSPLVKLLAQQRRRCVATVLSSAEASGWWHRLSQTQRDDFREDVQTAVQVLYDFARDVIKVTDEGMTRNDIALELIRSIHKEVVKK